MGAVTAVSIHAPAKGRRPRYSRASQASLVSIHAPAKGRQHDRACVGILILFRSTPPRRGDSTRPLWRPYQARFDPRPREGATADRRTDLWQNGRFDPRPREGATSCASSFARKPLTFRSTPPRRGDAGVTPPGITTKTVSIHAPAKGRQWSVDQSCSIASFDPRPREGATCDFPNCDLCNCVSIHAPAKGRPAVSDDSAIPREVSIHAPAKGRPGFSTA